MAGRAAKNAPIHAPVNTSAGAEALRSSPPCSHALRRKNHPASSRHTHAMKAIRRAKNSRLFSIRPSVDALTGKRRRRRGSSRRQSSRKGAPPKRQPRAQRRCAFPRRCSALRQQRRAWRSPHTGRGRRSFHTCPGTVPGAARRQLSLRWAAEPAWARQ